MNYKEVEKKLKKLGCEQVKRRSGGSHRKWYNPHTNKTGTIPDWRGRDLRLRTLKSFLRALGIDAKDFFGEK